MANLVHKTTEPNFHNSDGFVDTLYFQDPPTREEVKEAYGVDDNFDFEEHRTTVSILAKLTRIEVYEEPC